MKDKLLCKRCYNSIDNDSKYCKHCGRPTSTSYCKEHDFKVIMSSYDLRYPDKCLVRCKNCGHQELQREW